MSVRVLEQAPVVQVNDNRGRLFELVRLRDQTLVCTDESVYPDRMHADVEGATPVAAVAIGDVRPTDVLVLSLDRLALQGQVIPVEGSILPAGLAALWSFAEVLRRGCQAALDIQPDELRMGLQPSAAGGIRTARVFLADALENGAGYAPELARLDNLARVLSDIVDNLAAGWQADRHQTCTESCPDCLRSYDNRRLHGWLDWRLALDTAALAAGRPLSSQRWASRSEALSRAFVEAFGSAVACEVVVVGAGLVAVIRRDRAAGVVLGHPLWRQDAAHLNHAQAVALDELSVLGVPMPQMSDPWTLQRHPERIFGLLQGA
jgi:DEAD/DEAH box helicase domain-containing protein